MNAPKQTTLYFRLRTFSPIHIGCDEVYEPTGFVVDENSKQLTSFDSADFIKLLDGEALDEFSNICRKGTPQSLVEIYRFMDRYKKLASGKRVSVSNAFIEHFKKTLKLHGERDVLQNLNRYQIKRTAFNPHEDMPYIPGSSVKGSIRTAILNLRNKGKNYPRYELEKDLTGGSFQTDPFSLIKVSDFIPVGEVKRRIVYGVNRKKKRSKFEARGLDQIFEIVEPGSVFIGSITITEALSSAKITKPITAKELTAALGQFFGSEKEREDTELKSIGIPSVSFNLVANQFPVRIGFHCGAECITIDGHRQIKIMKKKGETPDTKDRATTIWLAANSKKSDNQQLQAFGWAIIDQLSPIEADKLREEIEQEKQKQKQRHQKLLMQQRHEKKSREDLLRVQKKKEAEQEKEKKREQIILQEKQQRLRKEADERYKVEKLEDFKEIIVNCKENLPGEIEKFGQQIGQQKDKGIRTEMCLCLFDNANSLKKKKKFSKALLSGKKWAQILKQLCDDNDVNISP